MKKPWAQLTEPGCGQVHPSSAVVETCFPLCFVLDPLAALSPPPCLSPSPLSASHFGCSSIDLRFHCRQEAEWMVSERGPQSPSPWVSGEETDDAVLAHRDDATSAHCQW